MARHGDGPLAEDYRLVKQQADAAVKRDTAKGIANPRGQLGSGLDL